MPAPKTPPKPEILTQGEFDHMFAYARRKIDESGYGMWVSDSKIAAYLDDAFKALEDYWKANPEER